jgi:hypothetical protein
VLLCIAAANRRYEHFSDIQSHIFLSAHCSIPKDFRQGMESQASGALLGFWKKSKIEKGKKFTKY